MDGCNRIAVDIAVRSSIAGRSTHYMAQHWGEDGGLSRIIVHVELYERRAEEKARETGEAGPYR